MAGLGWRKFNAGEVLTANNFQSYAVDQSVQTYAGTAARGSAIGTAVSEGMVSYLADSNVVQAYTGSSWDSLAYATAVPTLAQTGLRSVIPTSVTVNSGSGSYDSTTGLITATGFSVLKLNGVFTSAYRNYQIILEVQSTSTATEITGDYLISGTASGTSYRTWRPITGTSNNTNVIYNYQDGISNFNFGRSSGSYGCLTSMDIFAPAVSGAYKRTLGKNIEYGYEMFPGSLNGTTSSFDGISLTIASGTANDTKVKVYGYN